MFAHSYSLGISFLSGCARFTVFLAALLTLSSASFEDTCDGASTCNEMGAARVNAMLQKSYKSTPAQPAPLELTFESVQQQSSSKEVRHCFLPSGWKEAGLQQLHLHSILPKDVILADTKDKRTPLGQTASLDAAGFREVTSLCCPLEMEMFFNRTLASLGLGVCSEAHVQGLMHWFTCVPDMDFQYLLDVIAHGNPCKYWEVEGTICPVLTPQCQGHWCTPPKGTPAKPPMITPTIPTQTTPEPTTTEDPNHPCAGDVPLYFTRVNVTHNNLNGQGPDAGPKNIRFFNIGDYNGRVFDMLVSSPKMKYTVPDGFAQYNGVYDGVGVLYMDSPSKMSLTFTFVESGTDTVFKLPRFEVTFLDIDTGSPACIVDGVGMSDDQCNALGEPITGDQTQAEEVLSITGAAKIYLGPTSELKQSVGAAGEEVFTATVYGNGGDNAWEPHNMTPLQQNRAVTAMFEDKSEFQVSYEGRGSKSKGREMLFTGKTHPDACYAGRAAEMHPDA